MMTPDPHWPTAGVWMTGEAAEPDIVVVGVPSSRSSLTSSRADLAPLEVRDRLGRFSTYHSELGVDFGSVAVRDMGNWAVSQLDPVPLVGEVMRLAKGLPEASLKLYLGGDNAITRPLAAAESDDLSRVGLITFDAHHDVRALDHGPNNGTPIRGLIEEHGLPGGNVVQIGIHSFANSGEYRDFCDKHGIEVVTMATVDEVGVGWVVTTALDDLARRCERIHVDVDLDVLDAAFAPGCSGSRPGGMTPRQLAAACRAAGGHPAVRSVDFVEVDPERDRDGVTVMNMANAFLAFVSGLAGRRSR